MVKDDSKGDGKEDRENGRVDNRKCREGGG